MRMKLIVMIETAVLDCYRVSRLFHQFKEMHEKDPSVDILEGIESLMESTGKSRRQIVKKLKDMELIKVIFWHYLRLQCQFCRH